MSEEGFTVFRRTQILILYFGTRRPLAWWKSIAFMWHEGAVKLNQLMCVKLGK
jgi:hypothetical protein